jgi:hypothetical protein
VAKQTPQDRKDILANLPPGTQRVKVLDPNGKERYVRPDAVDIQDHEILTLKGDPKVPIVMRSKPGRGKVKSHLPVANPQVQEIEEARDDLVTGDRVVQSIKDDPEGDDAFSQMMKALSEEAAMIKFERLELQRQGRPEDIPKYAAQRARVLKSRADLWINRKKIASSNMVDLDSPAFEAVFVFILETFKEAMATAGCREELIETTFTNLVKSVDADTWKEDAKRKMKDKIA